MVYLFSDTLGVCMETFLFCIQWQYTRALISAQPHFLFSSECLLNRCEVIPHCEQICIFSTNNKNLFIYVGEISISLDKCVLKSFLTFTQFIFFYWVVNVFTHFGYEVFSRKMVCKYRLPYCVTFPYRTLCPLLCGRFGVDMKQMIYVCVTFWCF